MTRLFLLLRVDVVNYIFNLYNPRFPIFHINLYFIIIIFLPNFVMLNFQILDISDCIFQVTALIIKNITIKNVLYNLHR